MRRGSEVPREKIADFLEKKGSIHLIEVIGTDGSSWSELNEEIDISPSTLTKRLGEAQDIGLIEEAIDESDSGSSTKYTLTDKLGVQIFHKMTFTQLKATARSLRTELQRFEEQKEELAEWVYTGNLDEVYTAREQQQQDGRQSEYLDKYDERNSDDSE